MGEIKRLGVKEGGRGEREILFSNQMEGLILKLCLEIQLTDQQSDQHNYYIHGQSWQSDYIQLQEVSLVDPTTIWIARAYPKIKIINRIAGSMIQQSGDPFSLP